MCKAYEDEDTDICGWVPMTHLLLLLLDVKLHQQQQHKQGACSALCSHAGMGTGSSCPQSSCSSCCSSDDGSSITAPAAAAATTSKASCAILQQYHRGVLQLFDGPLEDRWQAVCAVREGLSVTLEGCSMASLLQALRWQLRQTSPDHYADIGTEEWMECATATCRLLPSLLVVLLHAGSSATASGDSGAAEDILVTAQEAATLLQEAVEHPQELHSFDGPFKAEVQSHGITALDLVSSWLQHLETYAASQQCHSSSSNDSHIQMLGLLTIVSQLQHAIVSMTVAASKGDGSAINSAAGLLAVTEQCMRQVVSALAAGCDLRKPINLRRLIPSALWDPDEPSDAVLLNIMTKRCMFSQAISLLKSVAVMSSINSTPVTTAGLLDHHNMVVANYIGWSGAQELSTVAPWLLLLARGYLLEVGHAITVLQQLKEQVSVAAPGANDMAGSSSPAEQLSICNTISAAYQRLSELWELTKALSSVPAGPRHQPLQETQQQQRLLQTAWPVMPRNVVSLLQPQFEVLLEQWGEQLLPRTLRVAQSLSSTARSEQLFQAQLIAESTPYGLPLLQRLQAAAEQLCALLPLPLCCNNPKCSNMSRESELQLVGGNTCVCAGCEVARYCGRECQVAHRQAHKRVCKMIKKSRVAPAAAAANNP